MVRVGRRMGRLRRLLIGNDYDVSEVGYTLGNYDKEKDLIENKLPTITTDYCEIGGYGDVVYFTFIILSRDFNRLFFDSIVKFENVELYGMVNFLVDIYPRLGVMYSEIREAVLGEKYLQVNFNYEGLSVDGLFLEYERLLGVFDGIGFVNQRLGCLG